MSIAAPIKGPKFTISANGTYKLGDASDEAANGGLLIHIINDNTFTSGQITVQGQAVALTRSGAQDAFVAIPYRKYYLNGSVADGSFASTAITTTSILYVPAPGLTVALSVASLASGSCTVYVTPVIGAGGV